MTSLKTLDSGVSGFRVNSFTGDREQAQEWLSQGNIVEFERFACPRRLRDGQLEVERVPGKWERTSTIPDELCRIRS